MSKNTKTVSVGIPTDTNKLLDEAIELSGTLQSSVLRTALKLGLEQIVAMHKRNKSMLEG